MIKEYFTDGLIGLAILLSLFRTDLLSLNLNLNNLIHYPEVQDIILGQTAAYLPANFHSIQQSRHSPSQKQIELDNDALNSWYQNVNNLLRFRHGNGRQNEIETFLLSESQTQTPVYQNTESLLDGHSSSDLPDNENISQNSSQFLEEIVFNLNSSVIQHGNASTSEESVSIENTLGNDTTLSPFPGCNLTREDIDLIEALWKQDVDLGVGKEVYNSSLREEIERDRELELLKQKEKKKAQLAAREREDRARHEQAGRWLKQNFMRDGETGEWVKNNDTTVVKTDDVSNESLTLEEALDYLSSGRDYDLFNYDNTEGQASSSFQNVPFFEENPLAEFHEVQEQQEPQAPIYQMSNTLNGLVDYLSISNTSLNFTDLPVDDLMPDVPEYKVNLNSSLELDVPTEVDTSSVLFQNATMPTPGMDISTNFSIDPTPSEFNISTMQQANSMYTSLDFDLEGLDFFDDLPNLPEGAIDELDFSTVDFIPELVQTSNIVDESADMGVFDTISLLTDNLTDSSVALSVSPNQDFNDDFAGLEGATGGSNFTAEDLDDPYGKHSRLSESSSDSGISFHGGFSSPSSSSSPSYIGSPTSSRYGDGTTASNDTENDPHRTEALAHHVAHNHTYNTLPGQVPREVKKYAHKEPSKKGPHSRDQKRASEMKIPFTVDEIIGSSVDAFNDLLTKFKLTDNQLTLVRDIRRRGKNKVAAQNCRKRKVHVIVSLSDDLTDLEQARDKLKAEKAEMEKETRKMKDRFSYLHSHIFQSLRDERGEPYDPNLYSLQQSSDGGVFLVPRNVTANHNGSNSQTNDKISKKRKSMDH